MMRRPPAAGSNKLFLALAAFLLPWLLVEAQQQQQHGRHGLDAAEIDVNPVRLGTPKPDIHLAEKASRSDEGRRRHESPRERGADAPVPHPAATVTRGIVEPDRLAVKRTISTIEASRHDDADYKYFSRFPDERALATVALDDLSSVRAPDSKRRFPTSYGAGDATPHSARSLGDWELTSFVIMATVDGDLYACHRQTGKTIWHSKMDRPMVEVTHHRSNVSVLDEDYSPIDHYLWVVEPTQDGQIWMYIPKRGLVPAHLTMKQLVEMSPYKSDNPPLVFQGEKSSDIYTLDVNSGRPVGTDDDDEHCMRDPGFIVKSAGSDECGSSDNVSIGRTQYMARIRNGAGKLIATIRYWEWTHNNYDVDLVSQYVSTKDNQYITTGADGAAWAFDPSRSQESRFKFRQTFNSRIVRVFDVLRPIDAPPDTCPDLKVLPQPQIPVRDKTELSRRRNQVVIDRTERGGYYALGGISYPFMENAAEAHASKHPDIIDEDFREKADDNELATLLVGSHRVDPLLLNSPSLIGSGPQWEANKDAPLQPDHGDRHGADTKRPSPLPQPQLFPIIDGQNLVDKVRSLPRTVAGVTWDFLSNPIFMLVVMGTLFSRHQDLRRLYQDLKANWADGKGWPTRSEFHKTPLKDQDLGGQDDGVSEKVDQQDPPETAATLETKTETALPADVFPAGDQPASPPSEPTTDTLQKNGVKLEPATLSGQSPSPPFAVPAIGEVQPPNGEPSPGALAAAPEPEKKKKAHRGRRAGTKHRKKKREGSMSRDDEPAVVSVNEIVDKAKKLGEQTRLEPDIVTVIHDVQDLTGPIYRMGSLEVNEDQQLGTGSNGTIVFAGKWDGRDVAVKRMLIQFYDIASRETRLLRESDDHPNVIRYYAQQQRAAFLYIALELCQASLADVIERPMSYRDLAQAGERDLPNVLFQITNGLSHLHSLRIVHRDLKPQNILVNMGKDGKPRLLVSDFGLCKKLEGGQSSFGATTAHAAGTTGWRAPELLLDDDASEQTMMGASVSSIHSATGSANGTEGPNRRATRAIDIFSLGLVFFYVLTKGSHPYDRGDRYMREVNIRKNSYDLSRLDVMGDYAMEAHDVVDRMLSFDPSERPTAQEVMKHPFFWSAKKRLAFLCDVSDHFEKEPRDPPSHALQVLEDAASEVIVNGDFLKQLPREFVDSLGKQRKYTGSRLLDLLRALRNKRNHYEDMSESLKKTVGPLPDGYLSFWTRRFETLLIVCWGVVKELGWEETDRFKDYFSLEGV